MRAHAKVSAELDAMRLELARVRGQRDSWAEDAHADWCCAAKGGDLACCCGHDEAVAHCPMLPSLAP